MNSLEGSLYTQVRFGSLAIPEETLNPNEYRWTAIVNPKFKFSEGSFENDEGYYYRAAIFNMFACYYDSETDTMNIIPGVKVHLRDNTADENSTIFRYVYKNLSDTPQTVNRIGFTDFIVKEHAFKKPWEA